MPARAASASSSSRSPASRSSRGMIAILVAVRRAAAARAPPRARSRRTSATTRTRWSQQYQLAIRRTTLMTRHSGIAEVVDPAALVADGDTVFPGMVTESGDLVVVAVQRQGEDAGARRDRARRGRHAAAAGSWRALEEHLDDPRGAGRRPARARPSPGRPARPGRQQALAVLAAMVALLATGAVPAGRGGPARGGRDRPARRARPPSRPTAASRGRR